MLSVRGVVAGYTPEVSILNGVNLLAADGLVTLIIGPNGAGKSTLLKAICGYLRPSKGDIQLDGRSLISLRPEDMLRRGVAYLPQGQSVFPDMTVEENLELGAWIIRRDSSAVAQGFDLVFRRFPWLRESRRKLAGVLSGGEQRILEIARLTITQPTTLLLDEPSVGLMPKLVDDVYSSIALLKAAHLTILIVDQNIRKAINIADYVYVLRLGENSRHGIRQDIAAELPKIIQEWL